jgi:hypothetical protein
MHFTPVTTTAGPCPWGLATTGGAYRSEVHRPKEVLNEAAARSGASEPTLDTHGRLPVEHWPRRGWLARWSKMRPALGWRPRTCLATFPYREYPAHKSLTFSLLPIGFVQQSSKSPHHALGDVLTSSRGDLLDSRLCDHPAASRSCGRFCPVSFAQSGHCDLLKFRLRSRVPRLAKSGLLSAFPSSF